MLKALIKDQKIRVDAHKWGTGESIHWDSSSADIHLDKETMRRINGQTIKVRIRIPINSDRPIKVEVVGNPRKADKARKIAEQNIVKEIHEALSDRNTREAFVNDLLAIMENYKSHLTSIERATLVFRRLANHFGLTAQLTNQIILDTEKRLTAYVAVFKAADRGYFISLAQNGITIGQTLAPSDQLNRRQR